MITLQSISNRLDRVFATIRSSTQLGEHSRAHLITQAQFYAAYLSDLIEQRKATAPEVEREIVRSVDEFCQIVEGELEANEGAPA
jgi:DNA-directed RNA polymerase specialized sigma54-like protein